MIENPQTGKPPAAVHVHWTQYVLYSFVVLLWDLFETDGTDELLKMYLGGLGVTILAIGVGFWVMRRAVWLYQDAVQAGDPLAKEHP